ncbi:MAG TPA: Amuc_1100 family pilus-like protein [Verrucomicrobiae bacterium]|nr:Amuc_1100 family pilus-like protein [Verrucomicrobiae bacterium]
MSWLKRNLFFAIGSLVALLLMGLAGWFLYAKWSQNNEVLANLNSDYEKLKGLNSANPHPGSGAVNNIKIAQQQREQLRDFLKKTQPFFQPIPRIPDLPKVTDRDFSAALSQTIEQLRTEATNASVALPPDGYNFSFTSQKSKISFAPGSLNRLPTQLGEIKAIAEILFEAKVNALDNIRRERVSSDDSFGLQTDYLTEKTETNSLAVLTPYELTFRSFSAELAAVLVGFAGSPHSFVVKSINVEPAPAVAAPEPTMPVMTTMPMMVPQANPMAEEMSRAQREQSAAAAFASRYGTRGGGQSLGGIQYRGLGEGAQQPAYVPQPGVMAPTGSPSGKGGLPTVLDEKLLKITLSLYIVKPLPMK